MKQRAPTLWTLDAFFAWQEKQQERYELVDGRPLRLMAGAGKTRNLVAGNIFANLHSQLRNAGCTPFDGDGAVQTRPGQIRRPDAGVDRDPDGGDDCISEAPAVIAEVLSPTTGDFDTYQKLDEYKIIPRLRRIPLVETHRPEATMWTRREDGPWVKSDIEDMDKFIAVPEIGARPAMSDVCSAVAFPPEFRLVAGR